MTIGTGVTELRAATYDEIARYFGPFGGRFVPEALVAALDEVAESYERARRDPAFTSELQRLLTTYTRTAEPADRRAPIRGRGRPWCAGVAQA